MDNKSSYLHLGFLKSVFSAPFFCYLATLIFMCSICEGQDKIYIENEQLNGKVIEITPEKVKYKKPENPDGPVYSIARSKIKFLFNAKGGFLVINGLDSLDAKVGEKLINNFINPPVQKPMLSDKIFNVQNKQINCTIKNENETSYTITYNDLDIKYDKSSVAAIIYKNGEHKIVSDIDVAADVLNTLQKEKNNKGVLTKNDGVKKPSLPPATKEVPEAGDANNRNLKGGEADQLSNEESALKDNKEEKILITAEKKRREDSITERIALNKNYNQAITTAKSLYKKGDYENAKTSYLLALSLKPEESEPKIILDSINTKLADSIEYESLRATADSLFTTDKVGAVEAYRKILTLKPSDYYASRQINYLQKDIAEEKRLDEIRKAEEREKRYLDALEKAKITSKEKRYEEALAAYNEALSIHPENVDAKERARIMQYQVGLLKKASDK